MASGLVVETSVANNSPCQDSSHPDDHFQSKSLVCFFFGGRGGFAQLPASSSSDVPVALQQVNLVIARERQITTRGGCNSLDFIVI